MGKASDPRVGPGRGRFTRSPLLRPYRSGECSECFVSPHQRGGKARNETYFFNSAAEFVDIQERFITRLRDFCFLSQFGDLGWHTLPAASS
jgi:hypothetical protein